MDWESRRRKRQEMGGAASGNTSANVETSNSIADAWERRRTQRRQMDAGSEEARRQRSEEIDRINQSRMEQHTRNKAQELAFAGLRATFGSLQRAQSGQTVQMTAEEAGQKYKENQAKIAELDKTVRMGAGKVHTPEVEAQLDALEKEQNELAQYIRQLEDADSMQHDSAYKLNNERLHAQDTPCRLAANRKSFNKYIIGGFTLCQTPAEFRRLCFELCIAELFHLRRKRIYF